jgi:3-oxoacyl-[acyl-carrier protein] reductase
VAASEQSDEFEGQVAIVTGAAGALGRALADALWQRGASTCYLDLAEPEDAEMLAVRPRTTFLRCDLAEEAQVAAAVSASKQALGGGPSILINAAGIAHRAPLEKTTLADWDRILAANVTATFLATREVAPAMRAAGYGRILHLSSLVARTGGSDPGLAAYAAAKAALHGFARATAVEYASSGITSNVLAPGWIDAGMFAAAGASREAVPVGRFGTTADVVGAALYLVGPDAGFVTGQVLELNGGLHFG